MRKLMFWLVCIPTRSALAYVAARHDVRPLTALIGAQWLLGLPTGERKHRGAFGGRAWWADRRAVHGALFAGHAATGKPIFLWLDVLLGAYGQIERMSTEEGGA